MLIYLLLFSFCHPPGTRFMQLKLWVWANRSSILRRFFFYFPLSFLYLCSVWNAMCVYLAAFLKQCSVLQSCKTAAFAAVCLLLPGLQFACHSLVTVWLWMFSILGPCHASVVLTSLQPRGVQLAVPFWRSLLLAPSASSCCSWFTVDSSNPDLKKRFCLRDALCSLSVASVA